MRLRKIMPMAKKISLQRVGFILVAFFLMAISLAIYLDRKLDLPSRQSAMKIVQDLSSARDEINKCRKDGAELIGECNNLTKNLAAMSSKSRSYYVSKNGVLIGIDFDKRTVVVLEPKSRSNDSSWQCQVSKPIDLMACSHF